MLWRGREPVAIIYLLIKCGKFIIQFKKAINVVVSKLNAHLIAHKSLPIRENEVADHIIIYVMLFSKSFISQYLVKTTPLKKFREQRWIVKELKFQKIAPKLIIGPILEVKFKQILLEKISIEETSQIRFS